MVTTDNPHFADTLRKFRNHGISSGARERQALGQWHYEMVLLGFNYRLTDIACALGLRQLGKLESNLKRRREIAARYMDGMTGLAGLVPPTVKEYVSPAWHLYPVRLDLDVAIGKPIGNFPGAACGKHRRERSLHSGASASLLPRKLWLSRGRLSHC